MFCDSKTKLTTARGIESPPRRVEARITVGRWGRLLIDHHHLIVVRPVVLALVIIVARNLDL
jgi:hypothetical protein